MLSAPFQIDDLKKIISGDIASPVIDYKNSKIKDQSLLTYIYNLNLNNAIIHMSDSTFEERRNFFLSFINHKTIVDISGMSETYIKLLLALKDINIEEEDEDELSTSIFTNEEIKTLLDTDQEIRNAIERAAFVLDGIVVHIMLSINDINLVLDKDFQKIVIHRDPSWIGHTWINLLKNIMFNAYYYRKLPPLENLVYFPYQYEEPIYKGKIMFDYLSKSPCILTFMNHAVNSLRKSAE
jgi:hypothetical protein